MVVGQVKWFNAKAGFGFVTVGGEDVFVHHSEVCVGTEQFRYLVEGEYVELTVSQVMGSAKRQGAGIRGIGGGRLMCEVRSASASASSEYKGKREQEEVRTAPVRERKVEKKEKKEKKDTVVQQMRHKPVADLG